MGSAFIHNSRAADGMKNEFPTNGKITWSFQRATPPSVSRYFPMRLRCSFPCLFHSGADSFTIVFTAAAAATGVVHSHSLSTM